LFSIEVRDAVWARIDESRAEMVSFLGEYIRRKSINPTRALALEPGGTEDCQQWLAESLRNCDCFEQVAVLEAAPGQNNVTVTMASTAPENSRSVMFNGHSDVVPVTEQEYADWVGGDPWSGHVAEGAVYGRGACDMKGGNSAVVFAMRAIAEIGIVLPGRATASFVIGEESGEVELGPYHLLNSGFVADIAVVTEPSGLLVCPAAVGWFFFKVSVEGQAAHAAGRGRSIHPSREGAVGVNAIDLMARIMGRLGQLEAQWGLYEGHPLMAPGTMALNPVQVSGGGMQATTPDACSAVWAATLSPSRTCGDVIEEIQQVIASVTVADRWLSEHPPVITFPYLHDYYEPVNLSPSHPAVGSLSSAVAAATREQRGMSIMPTPSDANVLAAAGQPTIICGPGQLVGNGVHGLNEHIAVDELVLASKAYAAMMLDWCSLPRVGDRRSQ
jgi:acetylornithine deacetylase/succinyl-diaminopimelate desuccinylase-like protein